jgi:hypothetical protein
MAFTIKWFFNGAGQAFRSLELLSCQLRSYDVSEEESTIRFPRYNPVVDANVNCKHMLHKTRSGSTNSKLNGQEYIAAALTLNPYDPRDLSKVLV